MLSVLDAEQCHGLLKMRRQRSITRRSSARHSEYFQQNTAKHPHNIKMKPMRSSDMWDLQELSQDRCRAKAPVIG